MKIMKVLNPGVLVITDKSEIKEYDWYTDGKDIFQADKDNIPLQPTEDFWKIVDVSDVVSLITLFARKAFLDGITITEDGFNGNYNKKSDPNIEESFGYVADSYVKELESQTEWEVEFDEQGKLKLVE